MPVAPAAPSRRIEVDPLLPEKDLLKGFLDWYRTGIIMKVEGLTKEQATRRLVPTPTNLLGIVKHLGYVERNWFQTGMLGRKLPVPWTDEDPDADMRIEGDETVEGVIAFYREAIAESDRIIAESDLDQLEARIRPERANLRWILVHMIEETARHAGHADILREQTDGKVGE
jgi:uncharacterized damage-inducible protein DinB